jgi:YidC/Oxa1 family membrane protein insertase
MSFRTAFTLALVGFCVFCGALVYESGVFEATRGRGCILLQQTTNVDDGPSAAAPAGPSAPQVQPGKTGYFGAIGGADQTTSVGSTDPASGFKFQIEFDSKGAALRTATFSGYDNRDHKDPQPLVFLSPVPMGAGREVLPMANRAFVLVDQGQKLDLSRLSWKTLGTETGEDGGRTVSFEARIVEDSNADVLKLTKSYHVRPDTFLLECTLHIENLTEEQQKLRYDLTGPVGLEREGFRADMRKVVGGYRNGQGQVISGRRDKKALLKAETAQDREPLPKRGSGQFLWLAATNKYFAAILRPVPDTNEAYCDWVAGRTGALYNPDGDHKADSGDETIGVNLSTTTATLGPAGQDGSARMYEFQLYLGPKDKSLFDKNDLYRDLGFVQTIDFMGCCCPSSIINPLAFGILAIMKAMHGFIGNYGIVIIILVFLMRLIMHPITKKSQVSMSKMSKLAPRAEEIKKKYAGNKAEQNKRLMELYREQGASPITGMLPMFVQMPIWIALWSAVYTSIDLRGAAFLPFWITDLSVPDALVRFSTVTIPLLGWKIESLNLLPLLMGVAFYLQQKLMPSQASASTNPQMAQQQKMMMIMMPLLFPLMLYKAPSGVNLYIMSSTFAGVIEQHVIRKHIRQKEEEEAKGLVAATSKTGGKVKKKKPKPFYKY